MMHIHMNESQEQFTNQPEGRPSAPVATLQAAQITDILEGMSDALYAVDKHWRLTYINRKTEEIWGRQRKTVLGRDIWAAFPHAVGTPPYTA